VDARKRAIQNAPQVLFRNDPPLELQNVPGLSSGKGEVGYITFVLFPRHLQRQRREDVISHIQTFRDYFHYHIKASKVRPACLIVSFVNAMLGLHPFTDETAHSGFPSRSVGLSTQSKLMITVLRRARPDTEEKEKKTASGRTFKIQ
jgi:actin related protein 2/3 complex subunit 2